MAKLPGKIEIVIRGKVEIDPFTYSPSGASKTCRFCNTIYDRHYVDAEDYIPPVGDGCEWCDRND